MADYAAEQGLNILFLCQCGSNISDNLDMDAIRDWIRQSGKVDLTIRGNLLCSPSEKEILSRLLAGNNKYIGGRAVQSIVVAACSPKQHEKTFHELAEKHGINLARVQMANIREQCAWVTKDKARATAKAIRLIDAALERARYTTELSRPSMEVRTEVVILGGGIAGMQAALCLARAGRKVYLVDREISIGGAVIKTEEVAPAMECAPCLLAPLISRIRDEANIEVITNADLQEVVGFFGNFTVTVNRRARYVENSCIGCEECFEVCPAETAHAFHFNLGRRKAIYGLFAGALPAAAAIDREICRHFNDEGCELCREVCPFQAVNFGQQDQILKLQAGAILVATGFANATPDVLRQLGYKEVPQVFTTFEWERLFSSNGPAESQELLAGSEPLTRAAIIHCAGSLCTEGVPYCSGICCSHALKAGQLLRSRYPGVEIINLHNDLVLPHPADRKFFAQQQTAGTRFLRCPDLASLRVTRDEASGKIRITGAIPDPLEVELVILATGLLPAAGTADLARLLNIDLDENGFLKPDHSLLHSTGTVLDGIYAAGCITAPVNVAAAVTQAQAAAGDILSKLIPGREIELEVITSYIDAELCAGCKLCLSVCPFKAIAYDAVRNISVINEAICRGCGTCTAACPSGASFARHYSNEQLLAEIGGLLHG